MSEDNLEGNVKADLDLEKGWLNKIKDWFVDNWQTIIIVLTVLIIGVGLYNYQQQKGVDTGKESALPAAVEEQEKATENYDEKIASKEDQNNEEDKNNPAISAKENQEDKSETADLAADKVKNNVNEKDASENEEPTIEPVTTTSENGKVYTISAKSGDGITNLARRALKKYLSENDISDISVEQKIYIEDYLQNKTGREFLAVGETRSFSESLIKEAVDISRGLSNNDIKNLSKYESRIANL